MAQSNVYSVNVVGYYNLVTSAGGYSFISSQTTNTPNDISLYLTNGMVSSGDGSVNSVLYIWKGALTPGYNIYTFYTDADAQNNLGTAPGTGTGWYDANNNFSHATINTATGAFLYNPSAAPITNTLYGTVYQGNTSVTIQPGFNALSITPAISTNLDSGLINYPGTSSPDGSVNDVYYKWKGGVLGYNIFTWYTDADAQNNLGTPPGTGTGWYDGNNNFVSQNPITFPKVGEGFFILHQTAAVPWNYSFTVQ